MKTLGFTLLISTLAMLPALVTGQHNMMGEEHNLNASDTYHTESLYQVPSEWITQDGETTVLADFQGKPLMVVMFYGRCTGTCPVLIQRTWKLYSELNPEIRENVQVLAISFDHKNDTPEALKRYAVQEKLDIPGWTFATGNETDIRELAMLLGVQYRERSDGHYEHSNLITTLDAEGNIAVRTEGVTGDLSDAVTAIEGLIKTDLQ